MATVHYMKFSEIDQADNGDYLVGFTKDSNGCSNIIKSVSSIIAEARADAGKTLVDASDETPGFLTEKIKNGGGIEKVVSGTDNKDITLSVKLPSAQDQNNYIKTSINDNNELVVERDDSSRYVDEEDVDFFYITGGSIGSNEGDETITLVERGIINNDSKPNLIKCSFDLLGTIEEASRSQYIRKITLTIKLGGENNPIIERSFYFGWNMDNPYLSLNYNTTFKIAEEYLNSIYSVTDNFHVYLTIDTGDTINFVPGELAFHYIIETDDYNDDSN